MRLSSPGLPLPSPSVPSSLVLPCALCEMGVSWNSRAATLSAEPDPQLSARLGAASRKQGSLRCKLASARTTGDFGGWS